MNDPRSTPPDEPDEPDEQSPMNRVWRTGSQPGTIAHPMASEHEKTQPGITPRPTQPRVPERYVGLWQRLILQQNGIPADVTSNVFWLQTRSWHAHIQVPAQRPEFAQHASLQACGPDRLAWLAHQQGFAGLTEIEGEICSRERRAEFRPPDGKRDMARMVFVDADTLVETGIESRYLQIWERVPGGDGFSAALQRLDQGERPAVPSQWLIFAGEYAMYVRERARTHLPSADSLAALARSEAADDSAMRALVDFEVSFARQTPAGWRIQLSTLPFREGSLLLAQERLPPPQDNGLRLAGTPPTCWQVLEWVDAG